MLAVAESTAKSGMSVLIGPRRERPAYGDELDSSVGIVVNIPFGGTSKTRTEISSAARVLARARSARNLELRNLSLALHEAVHGLNVVRQNLAAASHRLELAERQQTMWESAYEKGELELIDLLRMQASAIAAKRQVMRLKIDEKRQTALYNQAVGNTP
jgi:outer membrane protein TolC